MSTVEDELELIFWVSLTFWSLFFKNYKKVDI